MLSAKRMSLWGVTALIWGLGCIGLRAQPDLNGWDLVIRGMEQAPWLQDLESLEPGCVRRGLQPKLDPSRWRPRSDWGEKLIGQLEGLPLAEHHANRALQRLLDQDMLCFRLMEASTDRQRSSVESAFESAGLPADWVVLPMALTGWDRSYYGPGRRAGPWAMDLTSALSHGLDIRRGWDERHVDEAMTPAAIAHAQQATSAYPDDPLKQVIAFVRGPQEARRFDPFSLDASLLEWCHLLRVILQVDRNFDWDDTHSLWALRSGQMELVDCPESGGAYFSLASNDPAVCAALRMENPWFTTDSIGFTPARSSLAIPLTVGENWSERQGFCGRKPQPNNPLPVALHVVAPGEMLGTIARDYGVRIAEIKRHNGLDGDLIRVGQHLEIPGSHGPLSASKSTEPAALEADTPWIWHTVREGESYWTIAQQYPHTDLAALMRMNDIPAEALRPGMKLKIPSP